MKKTGVAVITVLMATAMIATVWAPLCSADDAERYDTDDSVIPVTDLKFDVPSSFDLLDSGILTSVKDQSSFGTCSYFSTIAAMESLMLIEKLEDISELDLSEAFLAGSICTGTGYERQTEDQDEIRSLFAETGNPGAYTWITLLTLMNWLGPIDESLAPYSEYNDYYVSDMSLLQYTKAYLQSAECVNIEDTETIKYMLTRGYPGMLSCYASTYNQTSDGRLNFYDPDAKSADHSVLLVGYDDDYSASNFDNEPPGNGAWLIKNSWGTEKFGDGYAWVSYYDVCSEVIFLTGAVSTDTYDHQYLYDNGVSVYTDIVYENTGSMANIFTTEGDEILEAVSFAMFGSADIDYTVNVYRDLTDLSDPTSGKLASTACGQIYRAGMYTVDLDYGIIMNEGTAFSVVVTFSGEGGISLAVDSDAILECLGDDEFYLDPVASAGQSFVSSDGEEWTDIGTDGSSNVRVRAYTVDAPDNTSYTEAVVIAALIGIAIGAIAYLRRP